MGRSADCEAWRHSASSGTSYAPPIPVTPMSDRSVHLPIDVTVALGCIWRSEALSQRYIRLPLTAWLGRPRSPEASPPRLPRQRRSLTSCARLELASPCYHCSQSSSNSTPQPPQYTIDQPLRETRRCLARTNYYSRRRYSDCLRSCCATASRPSKSTSSETSIGCGARRNNSANRLTLPTQTCSTISLAV